MYGNRQIYLTQHEIDCLRDVISDWLYKAEKENPEFAKYMMKKGLGSAMRKLSEGLGQGKYFDKY